MNIQKETTLHLKLNLRGGACFEFSSMESSTQKELSPTSPPFFRITDGLNVHLNCKNKSCATAKYGGESIQPLGFGEFDMIHLARNGGKMCRVCFGPAKMTTCGFYGCRYFWTGVRENEEEDTGKGGTIPNKYKEMDESTQERWSKLEIRVYKEVVYSKLT